MSGHSSKNLGYLGAVKKSLVDMPSYTLYLSTPSPTQKNPPTNQEPTNQPTNQPTTVKNFILCT